MTLGSSSSGHGVLDGVTHRKGGVFPFNISQRCQIRNAWYHCSYRDDLLKHLAPNNCRIFIEKSTSG